MSEFNHPPMDRGEAAERAAQGQDIADRKNRYVRGFLRVLLNVFFSDIELVGEENIPLRGPVIFVGNHQNQFVDGMILASCIRGRLPSFLVAASSMTRPLVGWFSRALQSIPVRRPQDEVLPGQGRVWCNRRTGLIVGRDSTFLKQLHVGCTLKLAATGPTRPKYVTPVVVAILSDSRARFQVKDDYLGPSPSNSNLAALAAGSAEGREPDEEDADELPSEEDAWQPYSVVPKVNQADVYSEVWKRLAEGQSVGIFPEGGSHDRTSLLSLKAGVAIMAIGAAEKYGIDVQIVPCGLNYFAGHRFRSNVVVEFGSPVPVRHDGESVRNYRLDKRAATAAVLQAVSEALGRVVVQAPDLEALTAIRMARKIYVPSGLVLASPDYMELNRRFAAAYERLKGEPEVETLRKRVGQYAERLEAHGIRDYMVATPEAHINDSAFLWLLVRSFVALVVLLILALPGTLINLPVGVASKLWANRKARQALAASTVKVQGKDVIASYKFMLAFVFVPVLYLFYAVLAAVLFGWLPAVATLVILPAFSYASMRMFERGFWQLRFLRQVLTLERSRKLLAELRAERSALQNELRALVEARGPEVVPNFASNRVVAREYLDSEEFVEGVLRDPMEWRASHKVEFRKRRPLLVDDDPFFHDEVDE